MRTPLRLSALAITTALWLTACSHSSTQPTLLSTSNGIKAAQIQSYLRDAEETPATKFAVKWHPDVVAVSRDAAIKSLVAINRSGSDFLFANNAPVLAQLSTHKILFIWGIAIRRVVSVQRQGDYTLVHTQAVPLNEAMTDADIQFNTPLNFKHAYIGTHAVPKPVTNPTSSLFINAAYADAPPELPANSDDEADMPPVDPTPSNTYTGKAGDFDYEVAYAINGDKLNFDLEVRKSANDGAGDTGKATADSGELEVVNSVASLSKGLFSKGYDDIDIRLKANGHLAGISGNDAMKIGSKINIVDSKIQLLNTDFKDLSGMVSLNAIARLGNEHGTFHHNFKVMDVPVTFNIPIIINGVPFVAQIGFNFLVQIGLNGKHAALHTSGTVNFSGNGETSFSNGQISNSGDGSGDPELEDKSAMSPGVSGWVVSVQVPKVGFGIGFTNANIMSYIDHVSVASITNTAAIGSIVQCARYTLSSTAHVGAATNFSPLPFVGPKELFSKEIFSKEQVITIPNTKACQL
ncbi:MAG: hypothetical protein HOP20_10735 [Sulfuriferula sp.]|nr:hypothetical protein [Sulfuriferula sp.]